MLNVLLIAVALLAGGYLAFAPRLRASSDWKATITPLASIMGSGFLVSAPLLASIVGNYAVWCMAALLVIAFLVGGAIRFNIRYFEPVENAGHGHAQNLALLSRLALAGAYFISVSYYLQLLAAFALKVLGFESEIAANAISTALLLLIGLVGMTRGLEALERVEKYAVSLNLGAIGALLLGLAIYNVNAATQGNWALNPMDSSIDLADLRVLLGLLIVVQGFETSRYLGSSHPPDQRIRTMRNAQLISAAIYLSFVALATILFQPGTDANVTGIITMAGSIAVVLPIVVTLAAIGSQFSAAVADTAGSGGLIEDLTHRRLPMRYAYLAILVVTVALTWETDVNAIIAWASRAFALYYALQCAVAGVIAWNQTDRNRAKLRSIGFWMLGALCLLIFAVGKSSE